MAGDKYDILDRVNALIFVLEPDQDGRPVYAAFNRKACEATGLRAEDVIGLTAIEVYPGRLGELAFEKHCQVLGQSQPMVYEITLPIQSDRRRVRTSLEPELDSEGRDQYIVGISQEITQEQEIRELQTQTITLNKEMEHFISLAAHDLRSPMNNISALADMLREDFQDLGDGKLEIIAMLERVSTKAISLISDVISHAQATGATEEIGEFKLEDIANEIILMLDPAGRHSLKVEDVRITGDRFAVQIVLRNLIDNALKHNDPQSIELKISAQFYDDQKFRITVRDNGKGLAVAGLKFLNGGNLRTDTGFGLAGILRLIKARGGDLIASKPENGSGAKIHFTLPGSILLDA